MGQMYSVNGGKLFATKREALKEYVFALMVEENPTSGAQFKWRCNSEKIDLDGGD